KVSGGVSNISFSFRGNNRVREAMHAAFLYHAIKAGLDMGIVNAGQLAVYEEIPKDLLELVEDVLLNRRPDATERLVTFAETVKQQGKAVVKDDEWRSGTARSNGKILLATVKGDVHDIGKNIVGVVLGCNNYEVIDLGVMVPCEKILQTAREREVDMIGLSGLITPSLDEMVHVAKEMKREGFHLPLLIGGATTSKAHTSVKIAPNYDEAVVHVLDASRAVGVVGSLINPQLKPAFLETIRTEYEKVRAQHAVQQAKPLLNIDEARKRRTPIDWKSSDIPKPEFLGARVIKDLPLSELIPFIDW